MMTEDQQLLRQYTAENSEAAFGELVNRHIDLVFSAALRMANSDRHLAQDITQTVFADLARKAATLPAGVILPGWLYRHTCFTASKAVRTEIRRHAREQIAMEMNALENQPEAGWELIAPQLEEAMGSLAESDRDALVLRFFKRQDFRTVGDALGISEDAAQKRVSRALDKLREVLNGRGVTLTAATLGTVLIAESVTAAPVGLALSVASGALTAASTGAAFSLVKLMTLTKLQWAVVSALAVVAVGIPLSQNNSLTRLREENNALQSQTRDLSQLRDENQRLAKLQADADELARLRKEHSELLQLRGEVTSLRNRRRETLAAASRPTAAAHPPIGPFIPTAQVADAGAATPEDALQTFFWACLNGKKDRLEQIVDYESWKKWMHDRRKERDPDFDPDEPDHDDSFAINNLNSTPEKVNGVQILSQQVNSTNQIEFQVAVTGTDGETDTNRMIVNQVSNLWRVDMMSFLGTNQVEVTLTQSKPDGEQKTEKLKVKVEQTNAPKLVPAD